MIRRNGKRREPQERAKERETIHPFLLKIRPRNISPFLLPAFSPFSGSPPAPTHAPSLGRSILTAPLVAVASAAAVPPPPFLYLVAAFSVREMPFLPPPPILPPFSFEGIVDGPSSLTLRLWSGPSPSSLSRLST